MPSLAFEPDLKEWSAWSPGEVSRRLAGVKAPWYVTAGWAIDLFLGGGYRDHDDLEIGVPRDRFSEIEESLDQFELFVVGVPERGFVTPLEQAGDALDSSHQTWVREPKTGLWRLDVMREPSDGATWICRRDERIRMPYDQVIERTADGIPYARPEIVLLFKAKAARPKDDADFLAVLPHLGRERRRWLADALELVHPAHAWLERLAS
jgi:hypothetical protein